MNAEPAKTSKTMDGKLCPVCREFKPLSEYGKRMRNGKNIGQAYCNICKRIIDRNNKRTMRELQKSGKSNIDIKEGG